MITGGHNLGRVGTVTHRERHPGGFDIVHIKDSMGHSFATRFVELLLMIAPAVLLWCRIGLEFCVSQ